MKKQVQEPRTRIEQLLIELLYQTLNREDTSQDYVISRLKKAGLSNAEIPWVMS